MLKIFYRIGALLALSLVLALPVKAETLLQALIDGYGYSSEVDAQLARIRRSVESINEANIADDLTADLVGSSSGGYRESFNRTSKNESSGISVILNAELRATLPIIRPTTKHEIELQKASLELERYQFEQVISDLFSRIVASYNDVYVETKKLELYQDAELRARSQVEAAEERFAVGQVTRSDVARAKASLAQAISELLDAETQVNLAWISLSNLVGKRYSKIEEPTLELPLPSNEEEAIAWALSDNAQIGLARSQVQSGSVNINLAEARDDLRFDLVFSVGKGQPLTNNDLQETDSFSASIGGNVTYPLYDAGRNQSQVAQAEIAYTEALDRLNQARLNIELEAESVVENEVSIAALLDATAAEIEAQSIALDGVKEEEAVGTKALVDVLNAERDLLLVRIRAIDSENVSTNNRFAIYRITGRLGYPTLLSSEASNLIDRSIVEKDWLNGQGSLNLDIN